MAMIPGFPSDADLRRMLKGISIRINDPTTPAKTILELLKEEKRIREDLKNAAIERLQIRQDKADEQAARTQTAKPESPLRTK
jgi:hypothetical protein